MNGIICRECGGSGCEVCNHTGYSQAYRLEHPYRGALRRIIIACEECKGSGCSNCNELGYIEEHFDEAEGYADSKYEDDTVPMPYGKMLPDLTDCNYPNEDLSEPGDEDYDDFWDGRMRIVCPGCGSDHVVGLDEDCNPEIEEENVGIGGRWFCISCQDSWCYEREYRSSINRSAL